MLSTDWSRAMGHDAPILNAPMGGELLGIGPGEAEDRRLALLAQQRWESEGGALQPENSTTGAHVDRRKVGVGTSCPQSPLGTDRDVRAESESSC
jgi:hypothetical protein